MSDGPSNLAHCSLVRVSDLFTGQVNFTGDLLSQPILADLPGPEAETGAVRLPLARRTY